jgi:putative flippase GtrA
MALLTPIIGKALRFFVVGFLGTIIDFGLTYVFKEHLKANKFISNAIGFIMAAIFCYFLNKVWTYESQTPLAWGEFFVFFIVSLIGLGINSLTLYLLADKAKMHFYLSKCFAVAVASVWNFIANLLITFA